MSDEKPKKPMLIDAADELERVAVHATCQACDLVDHHEGHAAIEAYRQAKKNAGGQR